MDTHKNARLTPKGREDMVRAVVDGGQSCAAAARKFNTTPKTVAKWVKRFRAEGVDGLRDRSSRPLSSDSQAPQAICDAIEVLRRARHTGKQIAAEVGVSPATVCRVLKRRGLNKLSALEPAEPIRRYERENPGDLIHLDIKKLGRIGSWDIVLRATTWRRQPSPWHRLGVCPCLHRRCLPRRLCAGHVRSAQRERCHLPIKPLLLITPSSVSASSA